MTSSDAKESEIIDLTTISDQSGDEEDHNKAHDGADSGAESDTSEVEIHLNENTRSQLKRAIATVSTSRLRQLLMTLVESERTVEVALTRELVTLDRETLDIVPRWETCRNCEEEFDVNTRRRPDECHFHPGDLEPDEDSFADWDERCHGPIDCEETRAEYPENFNWSCCDNTNNSLGCVQGEHEYAVPRKRRRI